MPRYSHCWELYYNACLMLILGEGSLRERATRAMTEIGVAGPEEIDPDIKSSWESLQRRVADASSSPQGQISSLIQGLESLEVREIAEQIFNDLRELERKRA